MRGAHRTAHHKHKKGETLQLWAVTMIDPATGWFEMASTDEKSSLNIANQVEISWSTRCPWPQKLTCDRGSEFFKDFASTLNGDCGIKPSKTTVRNPQANSIVERMHQTLGNVPRTFQLNESTDENMQDAWQGTLAAAMFALRATHHTAPQATPSQLAFGRDATMNAQTFADWTAIEAQKQHRILKNNEK